MSRIINLASDTYPCAPASGIVARRVVVMDPAVRGNVKLPANPTPEKTSVGVSTQAASPANNVSVQLLGVAPIESDGSAVINPGDYVIAGPNGDGRIRTQAIAAGSANIYDIIGQCVDRGQIPAVAGAIVSVLLGKRPVIAA